MISWKHEGKQAKQGISIYRDWKNHRGIYLRIGKFICGFRYSVFLKRFFWRCDYGYPYSCN